MGATQYVPVAPELIDEGEFMEEFNEKLGEAFQILRKHRLKFEEKAKKATVKVVAEVDMTVLEVRDGTTAITWQIQVKQPKRPAETSFAIDGFDQNSEPVLLVKAGGSDGEHPRQMKFATSDGRDVDLDTGEVEPR